MIKCEKRNAQTRTQTRSSSYLNKKKGNSLLPISFSSIILLCPWFKKKATLISQPVLFIVASILSYLLEVVQKYVILGNQT